VADVPDEALRPGNKNGGVLMWAASGARDPAIIAALVGRGADVNEADPIFSGTPLTGAAAYTQHPAILEELVRLGADIDKRVNNNQNALMVAAQFNTNPGIVEKLVALGLDPSATDSQGRTALKLAQLNQNKTAEEALAGLMAVKAE
jgi:ankyrin repeat protein